MAKKLEGWRYYLGVFNFNVIGTGAVLLMLIPTEGLAIWVGINIVSLCYLGLWKWVLSSR